MKVFITTTIAFLFLSASTCLIGQTVITSFSFSSLTTAGPFPYPADGTFRLTDPEIVSTLTINAASGYERTTGRTTGINAFAFQAGQQGNDAVRINHNAPAGANYYQVNLSGTTLSEYANYKVYCQIRRNTGGQNASLQYSTDGTLYTNLPGSNINLISETYTECLWDVTSVTGINNVSELYFRIQISGTGSNARLDNLQIEAINTVFSCPPPTAQLVSYMVNGCGSGCEGADEYLVLSTGADAYDLNDLIVAWPDAQYGATQGYCHSACGGWNVNTNNYFTQLTATRYNKYNTVSNAECSNLMIAPSPDGIVPPNSYIIVFVGCANGGCADYDFSAFCDGPLYAIAMGDNTCNDGRFSNSNERIWSARLDDDPRCGLYTQVFQMHRPCGTAEANYPCTVNGITYQYEDRNEAEGNAIAVTGFNTGYKVADACLTPVPLPIELVSFEAKGLHNSVQLTWETASEQNNDFFTLESSQDGITWSEKGRVYGAGNSIENKSYSFDDRTPSNGVSYYRLKQTDFDGVYSYSDIRSVIFVGEGEIVRRINLIGQEVDQSYQGIVIVILSNGHRFKTIQ